MKLGERMRTARKAKAMSLEDVSKKIGITRQTMSRYENSVIVNIPTEKVEAIAKVLDVTPAYLMGWTDDPENNKFDPFAESMRDTWADPGDREFAQPMLELAKKNEREMPALNEKEKALNTLLNEHGLNLQKYTTKGVLTDYGLVGREGGMSFSVDKFNSLMEAIEDSILRIYVRFANEGEPEWLQQRRNKHYGLSDMEE